MNRRFNPEILKDVMTAMSEARMEEGAKRKGRRWSLDTITPRFNLWKRSVSVVDNPLSHRNSIATPDTIREEIGTPPTRNHAKKPPAFQEIYAILDVEDGGHVVLSGRNESHLRALYVEAAMEYRVSSYRVIVASTKSVLKLDNGSPTVTKSFEENTYEKFESLDPNSKSDDGRFSLVEDLLQSEREYCAQLRSVFDCYAEPLRKYSSLSKEDHRMLFMSVEPILSISAMLTSKLEGVLQSWNTQTSKVGNLFPSKFWNQYNEYYDSYPTTKSFLEEKCKSDTTFAEFCNLRKEQGKLGIDTLLYLPVKRIAEYDKYLNDLLDETGHNHPDFDDLRKVANKVNSMVREREDEVKDADNENKVEAVQDRFPYDDLNLRDKQHKSRGLAARRKSAPSAVLFKSLGSSKSKSSSHIWSQSTMGKKDGDVHMRLGTESNRQYIMEGPVQLAAGMQTQDRYLFLFNDLLLVAKQKSSTTFKLKQRITLCDIWIAHCIDEVTEITVPQERSFVIGWPTTNTVATFKDQDIKDAWLKKLSAQVQEEKSKEESRTTQLKVVNRHIDQKCTIPVHNTCEARDVLRMCMEQLLIPESEEKDYQLWVLTGKDSAIYPLIGHEYPYAIKLSHVREQIKPKGDVDTGVLSNMDSIMEESASPKVEFILKHKKSPKKHSLEDTSQKSLKKSKKSPLLTLFKRGNKDERTVYPAPGSNNKPGKLFERPLEDVCEENGDPPKQILELLTILFREGPLTSGILRKSANARQIREIRQKLDNEEEVNIEDCSRCVIGSLVKEYFRNLPSCLMGEPLYDQWIKSVDIEDGNERLDKVLDLYHQLPSPNQRLLKLLMSCLYQIDQHQDLNMMSANNISVCIAPSLLWQKSDDMSNLVNSSVTSVVSCVEFLITNACNVFGDDIPHLLGEVGHKMRQDSGTDSDSLNNGLRRDDSSIDSLVDRDLYQGEVESSPKLAKSHLSPSNLSHDSGLSHSDTQLNEDDDYENDRKLYRHGYMDSDGIYTHSLDDRYNLESQNPVAPPRYHRRKDFHQSSSFDTSYRGYGRSYGSHQLSHSLEPDVLRDMQLKKRISCDSLQSVEESTEGESEQDFPAQRNDPESYLVKSTSGGHIYFCDDSQLGKLVRQYSVTGSTPPLSPHSKMSYGSSFDSMLSDSSYMQDLSRGNSVNSAPQTPDEFPDRTITWRTEERERSNSNPTRLHSTANPQESSNSLSASYGGYSLKSVQNMRYLVSPPVSPMSERRTKHDNQKDLNVRHSLPATFTTTVQKEVAPITSPEISITYCSSGSDERLDDDETMRKTVYEGGSSGAPVKQISLYSQGLSSQSRFGVHNQRTSPRKETAPLKASHDSAIISQVRRNSLESSAKSDDDCESRTSSLPEGSKYQRMVGSNVSGSDGVEDRRPNQPPSYQEAVQRTNLIKQGVLKKQIPLEISEQDTQKQKEASARAKKLYAESLRQYLGTGDSPSPSEKSSPVQMQQTSHLKQHIEQTSDPVSKTYRTRVEESSSVEQYMSPEEDDDVYTTLRKDPWEVFEQSKRLYEQSADTGKADVKSHRISVGSPRKDNNSAYSKDFSRSPRDSDSQRVFTDSSRGGHRVEIVRTKPETESCVRKDNVKTTLNVPSSSIHRSLSDSAERLNKFSKYSPRQTRRDTELNKENEQKLRADSSPSRSHTIQRTTYFYNPNEEKQKSSSSSLHQYSSQVNRNINMSSTGVPSSKLSSQTVTVTVGKPSSSGGSSSSSAQPGLPWSVHKLKDMFDVDQSGKTTTTTVSSTFYNPDQKVSTVKVTSTSRPAPPPYKSPPPFRRQDDNSRLSSSSNSSNGSSTLRSEKAKSFSARKFGPQSFDYNSFSSSSEDIDMPSRYSYRQKDSSSGVSDQEMDSYTDISYV